MATVILGGGIIGLSTAYYLLQSQRDGIDTTPPEIHIVDSAPELLMSSSGYAGGFLALDWFSPPVAELGALSFRLHREIARKNDGQRRWGYAGSHCYSLGIEDRGVAKDSNRKKSRGDLDWLLSGSSRADAVGQNSGGDNHQLMAMEAGDGAARDEALNSDGSPAWISPQVGGTLETIATQEECGQIDPMAFCRFLFSECVAGGVKIHLASHATEVRTDSSGILEGVKIEPFRRNSGQHSKPEIIKCSSVLLSAGAWTPRAFKTLFPRSRITIPITPLSGHSVSVKSPRYKKPFINNSRREGAATPDMNGEQWMCYAIYCPPSPFWPGYAPEAYARLAPDGETEIWMGGLNDSTTPLPDNVSEVKALMDPKKINELRKWIVQLSGLSKHGQDLHEDDLEFKRGALCIRPASRSGFPILDKFKSEDLGGIKTSSHGGVYIASGHGPWGITMSLGTGLVMSELIQGKKTSADIRALGLPVKLGR